MQARTLGSLLVRPVVLAVALAMLCAAVAGGLLANGTALERTNVLPLVALLASVTVPIGLILVGTQTIRRSLRAVDDLARSMIAGSPAPLPASIPVAEIASTCEQLVHATGVVRGRECALRAADRAKDEFLAMLGHELRNPLSAQAAAAHVLRKAAPGEPQVAHAAAVISRQVQQMSRLIEDLLDVSRVIRGKVRLSRQPMRLSVAIEKAAAALRAAGRLDKHTVEFSLSEVWVHGDEARLEQVVANLLGNAVKYTPAGGHISVSLRRDRDHAVLRVRDTGIGMPAELTSRAFELFVQGQPASERSAGGLGIGLALVKHLAELHGGKAYAASRGAGQGSVFTVSLPAIEARYPDAGAVPIAAAGSLRHRIVLVETDSDHRAMMLAALRLDGHRVYEAADVGTGLRAISVLKPDVALVDVSLGAGDELARALRDDPARPSMVLIAMTGREQPETLQRARRAGFDDCVEKPIPPDRLARLVDAAVAARKRRMQGRPPRQALH